MLGVDLGLNVGSIIVLRKRVVKDSLVFKFTYERDSPNRLEEIADRYSQEIIRRGEKFKDYNVAIEEPIFSWGRKNPKAFAKLVELRALIIYQLHNALRYKGAAIPQFSRWRVWDVNNKTAKAKAGSGKLKKAGMVDAYRRRTGSLPGHSTKYGQETLADSYFIALAGYDQWDTQKGKGKG